MLFSYKSKMSHSDGLNYRMKDGVPDIHRNYNRWIKNLNKYIQVNLSRL